MMRCFKDIFADLSILEKRYKVSKIFSILSNSGIYALICYRLGNSLYNLRVPLILTRIIQVLYAIDIDYRSRIEGGVIIIHGVGLVVGAGVYIKTGTTLYHQVTLGI